MSLLRAGLFAVISASIMGSASAALVPFSHTFDGTEDSSTLRIFRDGTPSVAASPKAFPGTIGDNPTYYTTTTISDALPGSIVTVLPTSEDVNSFLSAYKDSFSTANLALNYLADQGLSDVTSSFTFFAPSSGQFVVVGNTVSYSSAGGHSFAADILYNSVPEPSSLALLALGAAACFLRRSRH
jgi:hypothetical protein